MQSLATHTLGLNEKLWVFVSDPVAIDFKVYTLWISGSPIKSTIKLLSNHAGTNLVPKSVLTNHVKDQYRFFHEVEPYLFNPNLLEEQIVLHLDPSVKFEMLEKYYSFDPNFIREIIGKRLNDKLRGSLSETSAKLNLIHSTCLRQFDNLKRINKFVHQNSDNSTTISMAQDIERHFCISARLSEQYASMVYIFTNRFEFKKKVNMTFKDIHSATKDIISNWSTFPESDLIISSRIASDASFLSPHTKFSSRLRDLKTLIDSKTATAYSSQVLKTLSDSLSSELLTQLENKLPAIIRQLILIAAGTASKDFKKIFGDWVEKVGEPLKRCELQPQEIILVFDKLGEELPTTFQAKYQAVWKIYLTTVKNFLTLLYDRI